MTAASYENQAARTRSQRKVKFRRLRKPRRGASPFSWTLWAIMGIEQCGFDSLARRSGVAVRTLQSWFYTDPERGKPYLPTTDNLEAALNALGWRLAVVRIDGRADQWAKREMQEARQG